MNFGRVYHQMEKNKGNWTSPRSRIINNLRRKNMSIEKFNVIIIVSMFGILFLSNLLKNNILNSLALTVITVIGLFCGGILFSYVLDNKIQNINVSWSEKETNRFKAIVKELKKLGINLNVKYKINKKDKCIKDENR